MARFRAFGWLGRSGRGILAAVILSIGLITLMKPTSSAAIPPPPERMCSASDVAGFARCIDRADRGEVDRIVVAAEIRCGHDLPCGFVLRGITRPLAVVGSGPEAGFSRAADSRAGFGLRIEDSTGPIVIRGLRFDMGRSAARGAPGELWTDPACPARRDCPDEAIAIIRSRDVLVDQVEILDAKTFGIGIVGSTNVTIRRSGFVRSGVHGIWVMRNPASRGLHIENNRFIDIRSNAAMLSALPPEANDPLAANTVTGNVFDHNHNAALYRGCGRSGHDPCAGGQLDIEQQSHGFLIADNEFRHAALDEDPSLARDYRVAGVETAGSDIQDLTIRHNYFHDLSAGAVAGVSAEIAPQVQVIDNAIEAIGTRDAAISEVARLRAHGGNCEDRLDGCRWVRPAGHLDWMPCRAGDPAECRGSVRWRTQAARMPLRLVVDGRQVVELGERDGDQRLTIDATGRIDLYADATLLDTIVLPVP